MAETAEKTEQVENKETPAENMVPESRLKEEEAKTKAAEEKAELIQSNQELITQHARAVANAPKVEPFDIYKKVGLDPNDPTDIPNQQQQKEINAYFRSQDDFNQNLIHTRLDHPDFNEIVGTSAQIRSGMYAAPLAAAIKADPAKRTQILNSPNQYEAAYQVGKAFKKETAGTTKTDAEIAIDEHIAETNRIKTSANAQGGDGLSEKGRVENMTDAEFIKKFREYGGDL